MMPVASNDQQTVTRELTVLEVTVTGAAGQAR